eukprot:TCONS_00071891-protein
MSLKSILILSLYWMLVHNTPLNIIKSTPKCPYRRWYGCQKPETKRGVSVSKDLLLLVNRGTMNSKGYQKTFISENFGYNDRTAGQEETSHQNYNEMNEGKLTNGNRQPIDKAVDTTLMQAGQQLSQNQQQQKGTQKHQRQPEQQQRYPELPQELPQGILKQHEKSPQQSHHKLKTEALEQDLIEQQQQEVPQQQQKQMEDQQQKRQLQKELREEFNDEEREELSQLRETGQESQMVTLPKEFQNMALLLSLKKQWENEHRFKDRRNYEDRTDVENNLVK